MYIGAPSSEFRVRIYDKALEQGVEGHWIRVELVMRSANANAFVEDMTNSENVGKLAAQVINDKFSFIERDDSNISRCTVCDWWQNFVDELDRPGVKSCVSEIRQSQEEVRWKGRRRRAESLGRPARRDILQPGISRQRVRRT